MATVLEIVGGAAKVDHGHRCEEHSCCGKVLEEDVVVGLRREQILVPNRLGRLPRGDGLHRSLGDGWAGLLPHRFLPPCLRRLFDGVLCQVVSIGNAFDDDHNERAKVKHACGYARAQMFSLLNEG